MTTKTKGKVLALFGLLAVVPALIITGYRFWLVVLGDSGDRDRVWPLLISLLVLGAWMHACDWFLDRRAEGYMRCTCGGTLRAIGHLATPTHSVGRCDRCGAVWGCERKHGPKG